MQRLPSEAINFDGTFPTFSAPILEKTPWPLQSSAEGSSAVAFLFIPPVEKQGYSRLVLTKRSLSVGTHKGQIGFAGGRYDAGDLSPADTAKREVEEEIGIDRGKLQAHGVLETHKSLGGSNVVPVIMTANVSEKDFLLNKKEVDRLFLLPWNYFSEEKASLFSFNMFGIWRHSYLFDGAEAQVWGLTARIIKLAGLNP